MIAWIRLKSRKAYEFLRDFVYFIVHGVLYARYSEFDKISDESSSAFGDCETEEVPVLDPRKEKIRVKINTRFCDDAIEHADDLRVVLIDTAYGMLDYHVSERSVSLWADRILDALKKPRNLNLIRE